THPLKEQLGRNRNVREVKADLAADNWEMQVKEELDRDALYAIVHCAWPGTPHGGLLGTVDHVIEHQLSFGTVQAVRLSRLLTSAAPAEGGRLVMLGSIWGSQKPHLSYAPYSLGKAAMEHTVRLLAPELARKKITINTVCPSFAGVGAYKHVSEHQ